MAIFFLILIIVTCVIIGFFILVQNPKGGGLSGSIAGFNNQFMGVKQTTDVLEKGTWVFAALVGLLCLFSPAFIPKEGSGSPGKDIIKDMPTTAPKGQTAPATNTGTFDSTKK